MWEGSILIVIFCSYDFVGSEQVGGKGGDLKCVDIYIDKWVVEVMVGGDFQEVIGFYWVGVIGYFDFVNVVNCLG